MKEIYLTHYEYKAPLLTVYQSTDIHHIKNVFRKQPGEQLTLVDTNQRYHGEILSLESDKMIIEVTEVIPLLQEEVTIDIAVGLLKQEKMHIVIQKCAEMGLYCLWPVSMKHCVVKLDKKKEKWDVIAIEALKQCGGDRKLIIEEIHSLTALPFHHYDLVVVANECESSSTLKKHIEINDSTIRRVLYIIGPEGGFDTKELEYLKAQKAVSISLGKNILRAETAAIVLGGVLKYEFDQKS